MSDFRDKEEFKRGRKGEKLIAGILMQRGCFIVPSYDYGGEDGNKAPRMQGLQMGFAIPDLDVSKNGKRSWVEVKTKWTATLHRMTSTWEHGIDLRLYRHYQQVQAQSGTDVWLIIYEERDGIVLYAKMSDLGEPRIYDGRKMNRSGMAFWPRDKFKPFTKVAAA